MAEEQSILAGRTAIVTGGGRGIGKAIGRRLAFLGADTVLSGTNRENLERTAEEIRREGGTAKAIVADISLERDVVELFRAVDTVDILINNAGIGRFGRLVDATLEDWDAVMNVNLRGTFLCSREAMRTMAGKGGRIINIASVVGIKGYAGQAIYTASKHGVMGLSKVMSVEGQADGVITQVIAPGGVLTDMVGSARPDLATDELMSPEDVADAVEFLLRQSGGAITDLLRLRRRNGAPW